MDDNDVMALSVPERHVLLRAIVHDGLPLLIISKPFYDGDLLFAEAERRELKAIVAKRDDWRSDAWVG